MPNQARPTLVALDDAIRSPHGGFDVAVKYRLVTYALGGDWRHWVCAINAQRSGVCLRFLYGVLLDDPHGVLRPGSANLMTLDLARGGPVDRAAVAGFVTQAVAKYEYFRANDRAVNEAARTTGRDRRTH